MLIPGWTAQTGIPFSPESVSATLTVYPGGSVVAGDLVQVAVEGRIGGDLIGGVLFEHEAPLDLTGLRTLLPILRN